MNSTDAGMKMCAGEFGQKMQEISKNDPRYKCSTTHKQTQGSNGPPDSLTCEGMQPMSKVTHHQSK